MESVLWVETFTQSLLKVKVTFDEQFFYDGLRSMPNVLSHASVVGIIFDFQADYAKELRRD